MENRTYSKPPSSCLFFAWLNPETVRLSHQQITILPSFVTVQQLLRGLTIQSTLAIVASCGYDLSIFNIQDIWVDCVMKDAERTMKIEPCTMFCALLLRFRQVSGSSPLCPPESLPGTTKISKGIGSQHGTISEWISRWRNFHVWKRYSNGDMRRTIVLCSDPWSDTVYI